LDKSHGLKYQFGGKIFVVAIEGSGWKKSIFYCSNVLIIWFFKIIRSFFKTFWHNSDEKFGLKRNRGFLEEDLASILEISLEVSLVWEDCSPYKDFYLIVCRVRINYGDLD
jgi:hypothetical protein